MNDPGLEAVLAQLWEQFAPTARGRVDQLEDYAAALVDGRDAGPQQETARSSAHKLAGALGSYGRPGSDAASRLEVLLREPGTPDAGAVVALVTELRAAVSS